MPLCKRHLGMVAQLHLYTHFIPRQKNLSAKHSVWKSQKKVSFNIASEASYVYILSGQKFRTNTKNGEFLRVFWKIEACGQTVLPEMSISKGQKLMENAKIINSKCDILSKFQTMWSSRNIILGWKNSNFTPQKK